MSFNELQHIKDLLQNKAIKDSRRKAKHLRKSKAVGHNMEMVGDHLMCKVWEEKGDERGKGRVKSDILLAG